MEGVENEVQDIKKVGLLSLYMRGLGKHKYILSLFTIYRDSAEFKNNVHFLCYDINHNPANILTITHLPASHKSSTFISNTNTNHP